MAHYVIRFARNAVIAALFVTAAGLGVLTGVVFAYAGDLPQISALDNYNPSTITRVSGVDGQDIGDFAVERRLVVGYDDIAPNLRMAIIAAEDGDFNSHFGLSISRIAVTVARDVFEFVTDRIRGRTSRPAGASTLTQQLARIVLPEAVGFYEGEISLERKIREAIVAIQIEKRYTKREILTMFANQMYWGHNAYGVEAASRLYFAKSAKDVTLEEAAMLGGIIQGNVRQSPYVNMDAAVRRRNYTLDRMAAEGFISTERGGAGQGEADRRPRRAAAAALDRAVLPRGSPQAPRSALRSEAAVRERPLREDDARSSPPGCGEPRGRRGSAADRQAPRLPPCREKRARREADAAGLQPRTLDAADRRRATSCRRWSRPSAAPPSPTARGSASDATRPSSRAIALPPGRDCLFRPRSRSAI